MQELSEKLVKHFQYLGTSPEGIEQSIQELLEREYRRRLAKYEHTDRLFQKKYGMTLDEFEATGVVQARGYSWEVESDAGEWELAVDGIRSMKRRLEELLAEPPHAR